MKIGAKMLKLCDTLYKPPIISRSRSSTETDPPRDRGKFGWEDRVNLLIILTKGGVFTSAGAFKMPTIAKTGRTPLFIWWITSSLFIEHGKLMSKDQNVKIIEIKNNLCRKIEDIWNLPKITFLSSLVLASINRWVSRIHYRCLFKASSRGKSPTT